MKKLFPKRSIIVFLFIIIILIISSCTGANNATNATWSLVKLVTLGKPIENSTTEIVEVKNCGIPIEKTTDCSAGTSNDLSLTLNSGGAFGTGAQFSIEGGIGTTLGIGQQSGQSVKLTTPPDGSIYTYTVNKSYQIVTGQILAQSSNGDQQTVNFNFHASCSIDIVSKEQTSCSGNTSPPNNPIPPSSGSASSSSICDNFDNATLDSGWEWIDPKGDSSYNLTDNSGFLRVTVYGRDHDLYQNLNAPRMLQHFEGDFTVTTKVIITPQQNYQAAGLLYWQDNNNYVRLERTLVKGIDLLYKVRGEYNAIEIPFSASTTFLKFEMSGQSLQGFYSEDGYNWNSVETVQVPQSSNGQIGIDVVNEWQDNSITADFDYFKFGQCP